MSSPCPDTSQNPQLVSPIMQTPNPVMSYNFINNIPMLFESSPDLGFKVVDAIFDENKVFSESSRFRAEFQSIGDRWRFVARFSPTSVF